MMLSKLAFFASVAYSMAIQVTSPSKNDVWETFQNHTVSWNFVDTDPKVAGIYLANYVSVNQNRFVAKVSVSDGSYTDGTNTWPTGEGYFFKFTNPDNVEEIYALSEGFTLTHPST
ncbi:developmentally Regulated MAPK Interacting protein [Schizosaccharomyces osmophilus]|uniref:Developmentally Regulated MAPK Interacting protein n=1 Tax=Schizosaccharomyces osmophilus TaxID=2545709 RepID=A0AAE9WCE3_9SCHI|nr:developmentally Regulated MAPK Interacting protein [Schizosaccharomyces osmophilus]WBW73751.1 developmentally Regulated MAPK Interacting protein [Schizosaccharomyces osmophilus]